MVYKSTNVNHHINELKNKKHMITSIDAEKLWKKLNILLIHKLSTKWVYREYTST